MVTLLFSRPVPYIENPASSKHSRREMKNFQELLVLSCFLSLGHMRGERVKERPSRVVNLKQGRVQGTLVELPLVSASQAEDTNSDTYSRQVEVFK